MEDCPRCNAKLVGGNNCPQCGFINEKKSDLVWGLLFMAMGIIVTLVGVFNRVPIVVVVGVGVIIFAYFCPPLKRLISGFFKKPKAQTTEYIAHDTMDTGTRPTWPPDDNGETMNLPQSSGHTE
jgi:hypothetical protein